VVFHVILWVTHGVFLNEYKNKQTASAVTMSLSFPIYYACELIYMLQERDVQFFTAQCTDTIGWATGSLGRAYIGPVESWVSVCWW